MKRHLSVANALSCLALFIALSGVAYAATLGKNSVKAKNIAKGAVTTPKLKNAAVSASKLADGAVIAAKLANRAVIAGKIADGSVVNAKLGNGAVTEGKLANNSVTTNKLAAESVATGKLGRESVTGEKLSGSLSGQLVKNVSYVTAQTVANAEEEPKPITAQCPAGKEVIGGGAEVTGADVTKIAITDSFPTSPDANGNRTAWHAVAMPMAPETKAWGISALAVCAEL